MPTQCNLRSPAPPIQHQAPIPRRKSGRCSGKCCGSHQSTRRHSLMRVIHLCMSIPFLNSGQRDLLVGLKVGLLLATSFHSPCGTARWRYAMAAKQCGSIEGRENPGPQTWSSSAMLVPLMFRKSYIMYKLQHEVVSRSKKIWVFLPYIHGLKYCAKDERSHVAVPSFLYLRSTRMFVCICTSLHLCISTSLH
jgi:hypothetical protein